jgi:ribose transport system permease protein
VTDPIPTPGTRAADDAAHSPVRTGAAGRLPSALPAALPARLASLGTLLGLVGLVVLFGALRPDIFLTPRNLTNILEQVAVLAMVAAVQTVVMVVGDFDLSVGALASLVGVGVAQLLVGGMDPLAATAVALAAGLAAGAVNGLLVSYLGLSAFIATLATMTAFTGLALLLSDGSTIFGLPEGFVALGQGRLGPVPVPVVVAGVLLLAVWFVTSRTVLGRQWYAVGGNAEAAELSGVNTRAVRFGAFCVSGFGAALAGVVLTARLASGHPTAADPFMLSSIAAVFLGMTLSRAGQPTAGGTVVGLGIVGVLSNGLNILQVNSYVQQVLTGVIIILAVSLSRLSRRRG